MIHTILIMAGGTGGHVFPGLAVADYMKTAGWHVVWLGTERGMETVLVPQRGYDIEIIRFSGLRGKNAVAWLTLPLRLLFALWQSVKVLLRVRPDVVLGMGGYPAFPGGLMASLLGKPYLYMNRIRFPVSPIGYWRNLPIRFCWVFPMLSGTIKRRCFPAIRCVAKSVSWRHRKKGMPYEARPIIKN